MDVERVFIHFKLTDMTFELIDPTDEQMQTIQDSLKNLQVNYSVIRMKARHKSAIQKMKYSKVNLFKSSDIFTRKQAFAKLKGFERFSAMVDFYDSAGLANQRYMEFIMAGGAEKINQYIHDNG